MDRAVFFQFLFYCDLVLEIWILDILFFSNTFYCKHTMTKKMIIYIKKNKQKTPKKTMRSSVLNAILNESD